MRTNKEIEKVIAFIKEKKGIYTRIELSEKFDVPYTTIAKMIKREGMQDYVSSKKNVSHLRGAEMGQVKEHKLILDYPITKEINFKDLPHSEKTLYASLFRINPGKLRYEDSYVIFDEECTKFVKRINKIEKFKKSNLKKTLLYNKTTSKNFNKVLYWNKKRIQIKLNWVNDIGNLDGK